MRRIAISVLAAISLTCLGATGGMLYAQGWGRCPTEDSCQPAYHGGDHTAHWSIEGVTP
jgi:hypothetical protein